MSREDDFGMCCNEEMATECAREYEIEKAAYEEKIRNYVKIFGIAAGAIVAIIVGIIIISHL